jgi:hypothetical protein
MPTSPPTRCTSCKGLIPRGGRCENPDCAWRYSAYKRNMISTSDPRWQAVRHLRLNISPYCEGLDPELGCGQVATDVDHVDGTDYSDHSGTGRSWLSIHMTRSLCSEHHRTRTAQQSATSRRRYES